VAKEKREVATVAAAGVEHAEAVVEAASEDLVEKIDVDLAEPGPELGAWEPAHRSG